MEVLTLQARVYDTDRSINIKITTILPRGSINITNRVNYTHGSINITNTSILPRWECYGNKHEYITQMEVLTLQTCVYHPDGSVIITTRVYNPDGSINITNTSILTRWKY